MIPQNRFLWDFQVRNSSDYFLWFPPIFIVIASKIHGFQIPRCCMAMAVGAIAWWKLFAAKPFQCLGWWVVLWLHFSVFFGRKNQKIIWWSRENQHPIYQMTSNDHFRVQRIIPRKWVMIGGATLQFFRGEISIPAMNKWYQCTRTWTHRLFLWQRLGSLCICQHIGAAPC